MLENIWQLIKRKTYKRSCARCDDFLNGPRCNDDYERDRDGGRRLRHQIGRHLRRHFIVGVTRDVTVGVTRDAPIVDNVAKVSMRKTFVSDARLKIEFKSKKTIQIRAFFKYH